MNEEERPARVLTPAMMELHLGVLNQQLQRLKGKMTICTSKMNMDEPKKLGIDIESEKLKFEGFNKAYDEIEKEMFKYEDNVLLLTRI